MSCCSGETESTLHLCLSQEGNMAVISLSSHFWVPQSPVPSLPIKLQPIQQLFHVEYRPYAHCSKVSPIYSLPHYNFKIFPMHTKYILNVFTFLKCGRTSYGLKQTAIAPFHFPMTVLLWDFCSTNLPECLHSRKHCGGGKVHKA